MADLIYIPQLHQFVGQQAHGPALLSSLCLATRQRNQSRFQLPIHFSPCWPFGLGTAHQRIKQPTFSPAFAHPLYRCSSHRERLGDALICPAWSLFSLIGFQ